MKRTLERMEANGFHGESSPSNGSAGPPEPDYLEFDMDPEDPEHFAYLRQCELLKRNFGLGGPGEPFDGIGLA